MRLYDTHCHFETASSVEIAAILSRAHAAGVEAVGAMGVPLFAPQPGHELRPVIERMRAEDAALYEELPKPQALPQMVP